MYCTNCGSPVGDNDAFCPNCGNKVRRSDYDNSRNFSQDIHNSYENIMDKPKNRLVAGLLAIFLGSLGIHDFYLGYNQKGVAHLLMFVFFLGWISQIWALVEALLIFTGKTDCDANGVRLTDNF